jgi:hypothetical protein
MAVLTAALTALGVLGIWLAAPQLRLEVVKCESQARLLSMPVEPEADFSVWFFHSYDRSYFEEHYRIQPGGRLLLSRMTFKSSLNGQGFETGTYRPRPDGSAELSGINREMDEIVFRLGSPDLANHTLIIQGRRLRLLNYADAGDLLCIRLASGRRWLALLGSRLSEQK